LNNISYVALSFTRKAEDILALREFLYKNNGAHIKIIAKIENQE
jgi:pyruvate kinase